MNSDSASQTAVPASQFTIEQLTDIYNRSRVDYIVPMPMNTRRMEEYMTYYDVEPEASIISLMGNRPNGIALLSLRDRRAWITRLGVIPEERRQKTGSLLVESVLEQARKRGIELVQLEVIKGNEPAYRLFSKFGFEVTRELLVIVRPPQAALAERPLNDATITPMDGTEIRARLALRPPGATWLDETASLMKMDNLTGYRLETDNGGCGWIVFRADRFQLSHFVYDASEAGYEAILRTLLIHVHTTHAGMDTKYENLPVEHRATPLFYAAGYVESFRRYEMVRG